jgi:hypothetical protein
MERLREIWVESGRPGAAKLVSAARQEGENITLKKAQEFVKNQGVSQVYQQQPRSDGKVVSTGRNSVWQIDLIDWKSLSKSDTGGNKYTMFCIDVFSRYLYTEPMTQKTPSATLEAFKKILVRAGTKPKELDSDTGNEFKGVFDDYLKSNNIGHRVRDSINSLAVADSNIKKLKDILAKQLTDDKTKRSWSESLKHATTAYNNQPHGALLDTKPKNVDQSKELQYTLEAEAGENIQTNAENHAARAEKLLKAGGFRKVLPRSQWERASQPKYTEKVFPVVSIENSNVVTENNQQVPVRRVLAVPIGSTTVEIPRVLQAGDARRDDARREKMRPFANQLVTILGQQLATILGLTLQGAGTKMRKVAGFAAAMTENRLVGVGALARFIKLYPELFRISGQAPNQRVSLIKKRIREKRPG